MKIARTVFAAAATVIALGGWTGFHFASAKPSHVPVVTITAHDYYFDPIPDIPSGVVDLRLHNTGKDFHHAAMFRLTGGHTAAEFAAAMKNPGPPPMWAIPTPGPNAPVLGGTSNSIAELTPGNYIVMCFIDTNGGVPHFIKGMWRAFRVVPSANKSKAPKADINITLFDYGFKFVPTITPGNHLFHITNNGPQLHEIEFFLLDPGKTAKELHDWAFTTMMTKSPAQPVGGVVNIPPGAHPEFRATMNPGNYVAICFIPDSKDGQPHILHGMEYAFEVK